jgi:peptidylprolyl isomerase
LLFTALRGERRPDAREALRMSSRAEDRREGAVHADAADPEPEGRRDVHAARAGVHQGQARHVADEVDPWDAEGLRLATVRRMATDEKPTVEIPADQAPSYQLELDDLVEGDGDEAVAGKVVEVHYVGVSWSTGKQFDASWDRGDTFKFKLGRGDVIAGWDQGVAGMKVGGRRRITIPPMLGYGKRGAGGVIGPDETLVFVVDLVGVR